MSKLELAAFIIGFIIAVFVLIVVLRLNPSSPLPSEWF
jgi:hypothetical protein